MRREIDSRGGARRQCRTAGAPAPLQGWELGDMVREERSARAKHIYGGRLTGHIEPGH